MRRQRTWAILVSYEMIRIYARILTIGQDAMNEVAWCYLEGYGCKKDKVRLRLAKILMT